MYWSLHGSDRYAPLGAQAVELLARIKAAEAGPTKLGARCDLVRFSTHSSAAAGPAREWWRRDPADLDLLDRIGAVSEIPEPREHPDKAIAEATIVRKSAPKRDRGSGQ